MSPRLCFLTDEDFDNDITRALLQRIPDLDLVRIQDIGLRGPSDPAILERAAKEPCRAAHDDRISLVGHQRHKTPEEPDGWRAIQSGRESLLKARRSAAQSTPASLGW
jgi:hypothetical protein